MSAPPIERLGARRYWCPETPNGLFGISARWVIGRGHARVFAWDAATGELRHAVDCDLWTRKGDQAPRGRLAADDGRVHVQRRDGSACEIDLATGAVAEAPMPALAVCAFAWPAPRVDVIAPGAAARTVELDATPVAATATPDGRVVAVGFAGARDRVDVHEVATGRRLARWDGAPPWHLAISDDGALVATGGLGTVVRVREVATGRVWFDDEPEQAIAAIAFAPDGRRVAGASSYRGGWVWTRGAAAPAVPVPAQRHVAFAAGGDLLGAGADGELGRWRPAGERRARVAIDGRPTSLCFLAGERALVTTAHFAGLGFTPVRDAVLADLDRGAVLARFALAPDDEPMPVAAASPDGRWCAAILQDSVVLHPLGDAPTAPLPVVARWPGARGASFAADGRVAVGWGDPDDANASAGAGGDVETRVFAPTGALLARVPAHALSFGPAGVAVERRVDELIIRDDRDFAIRGRLAVPHGVGAGAIAWSADGAELAYADGPSVAIVRLADLATR